MNLVKKISDHRERVVPAERKLQLPTQALGRMRTIAEIRTSLNAISISLDSLVRMSIKLNFEEDYLVVVAVDNTRETSYWSKHFEEIFVIDSYLFLAL